MAEPTAREMALAAEVVRFIRMRGDQAPGLAQLIALYREELMREVAQLAVDWEEQAEAMRANPKRSVDEVAKRVAQELSACAAELRARARAKGGER